MPGVSCSIKAGDGAGEAIGNELYWKSVIPMILLMAASVSLSKQCAFSAMATWLAENDRAHPPLCSNGVSTVMQWRDG
jgi:hypothetical protein